MLLPDCLCPGEEHEWLALIVKAAPAAARGDSVWRRKRAVFTVKVLDVRAQGFPPPPAEPTGLGVCGVGDHFGIFGQGHSTVGVYGERTSGIMLVRKNR